MTEMLHSKLEKWFSSYREILLAIIINTLFILCIVSFCNIKYEVSDDFIADAVYSGAFGNGYTPFGVFPASTSLLLGYVLYWLYQEFPFFSWYFFFQIGLCIAALISVSYVVLKKNHLLPGTILIICFLAFFANDLYITMQFTKTASIACCAGGILMVYSMFGQSKIKHSTLIIGIILFLLGSMLRFRSIYISIPFLFVILVFETINARSIGTHWKTIKKTILICCLTVFSAFLMSQISQNAYKNTTEYTDFVTFNSVRSQITDIDTGGRDLKAPEWNELNMDQTDYWMMRSWNLVDSDIYPLELLKKIPAIREKYANEEHHSISSILKDMKKRGYNHYFAFQGLLGFMALLILLKPRKWRIVCVLGGIALLLLVYFHYIGRVVYRVEYSLAVAAAICVVYNFNFARLNDHNLHKEYYVVLMIIALSLGLRRQIPVFFSTNLRELSDEEYQQVFYETFYRSWDNNPARYTFDISSRKPYTKLISLIKQDKDHYFLLDFGTTIQLLYYQYLPWEKIPEGEFEYYSYLGGVTMKYPDNQKLWDSEGIEEENPYRTIPNSSIFVIDNMYYETKLEYMRKYYDPDIRLQLVDTVDGFNIWSFSNE